MPSVADLLKQAAQAPSVAQNGSAKRGPMAGQVRASLPGKRADGSKEQSANKSAVPSIVDVESSQQPPNPNDKQRASSASQGGSRLGLPTTLLSGGAGKESDSCPAGQKMEEAVAKQQDLLAEFEKIADELNRVLANLEGSTLVKRLKAASRLQYRIAGRLADQVTAVFGAPATPSREPSTSVFQELSNQVGDALVNLGTAAKDVREKLFKELSNQEAKGSQDLSNIMDDMQGYYERRRFVQFKTVLDDMLRLDPIGSLRQLSDDLPKENGLSIAQCEYWSDTFDRWAEDLVDPASGGT
jgi:hypothetical protein